MKIVALIPLKGTSKSIPRKNLKAIAGKPLCYWTCAAATQSKHIQDTYVSTDDDEIINTVRSFHPQIKFIPEKVIPEKDISVIESVMLNFLNHVPDCDIIVTLQATSPHRTAADIDAALDSFFANNFDSMLTGVLMKRFYWTKDGKPLNYDHMKRPLRQIFEGTVMENGAFYITKKEILEKHKNRLGGKIGVHEMHESTGIELDEPGDWELVEPIILKRHGIS